MVTSLYEWEILERDEKLQLNKQTYNDLTEIMFALSIFLNIKMKSNLIFRNAAIAEKCLESLNIRAL